jgi:hypothetical protein
VIEAGQLRRWRDQWDEEGFLFVVLEPHALPMPGDWTDDGWWVLADGRQQWFYSRDIEDDSDLISSGSTDSHM